MNRRTAGSVKRMAAGVVMACVGTLICSANLSAASPIFGGPEYDAATENGHQSTSLYYNPGASVGEFFGLANSRKYVNGADRGARGHRWSGGAVVELGNLGSAANGTTNTAAYATNASGMTVGFAEKYDGGGSRGERAVRWNPGSPDAIELGNLGTSNGSIGTTKTRGWAVNAGGAVVGFADKYESGSMRGTRAVRWDAGSTTATELGHLGLSTAGTTYSHANAINNSGVSGGFVNVWSGNTNQGERPVRWGAGGTVATELDNLGVSASGASAGSVFDINESGTSIGYARKYVGTSLRGNRAVRWEAGGTAATELDILGTTTGSATSFGLAINDAGTAVGYSQKIVSAANRGNRAVRWAAGGTAATELGNLGTATGEARAINNSGIAVGYVEKYTGGTLVNQRAVYWADDAVARELEALLPANSGWTNLGQAYDISEAGWISGTGRFDPDGAGPAAPYLRMFLMLVPEAGTYGKGDANFDARVNFDDLLILAQNYGQANPNNAVNVGDLNLDGATNFDDLIALAQHYGASAVLSGGLDADFARDWALARSMVPEPVSVLGLAVFAACRRSR